MTVPERWRKRPVEIDAMHYPLEPTVYDNARLHRWINSNGGRTEIVKVVTGGPDPADPYQLAYEYGIAIRTLEGDMLVSPDDYVIRGVQGEFYPCKPDIFEATYERVT